MITRDINVILINFFDAKFSCFPFLTIPGDPRAVTRDGVYGVLEIFARDICVPSRPEKSADGLEEPMFPMHQHGTTLLVETITFILKNKYNYFPFLTSFSIWYTWASISLYNLSMGVIVSCLALPVKHLHI